MSFAPKTSTGAPLVPTVSPAIVSPATLSQPAHVDPSPRVDMPPATLPIPDARPSSPPTLTKTEAQEVEAKGKELARREYRTIHNKGTVVGTMPDDELFSMLRRFAVVRSPLRLSYRSLWSRLKLICFTFSPPWSSDFGIRSKCNTFERPPITIPTTSSTFD
jgi:hypothetical protein